MSLSAAEEYERRVKKELARFTEIFARISKGDFPPPIDCSTIEDKSFVEAFKGLNTMVDRMKKLTKKGKNLRKKSGNAPVSLTWSINGSRRILPNSASWKRL